MVSPNPTDYLLPSLRDLKAYRQRRIDICGYVQDDENAPQRVQIHLQKVPSGDLIVFPETAEGFVDKASCHPNCNLSSTVERLD